MVVRDDREQVARGMTDEGEGAASPQDVASIQRALTAIARRGRARSRAQAPQLSLVDRSLMDFLHDHPDSRAADIAAHYLLDKSTVSRQLAGLVGVSRKTINTVENGVFVPSTILALKLAAAIGKPVEQLFVLDEA